MINLPFILVEKERSSSLSHLDKRDFITVGSVPINELLQSSSRRGGPSGFANPQLGEGIGLVISSHLNCELIIVKFSINCLSTFE